MTTQVRPVRHRLYVHLVWTTRGRERLIDPDLARFLCRFLREGDTAEYDQAG